jgi:TRAP-type C4-dicarboxylate transport system permease small subunit
MLLVICADVFMRNVFSTGLKWGNEVSEYALYLMTLCAAPWLLHRGQHIRVDLLLRVVPGRLAWLLEWLVDLFGVACSLALVIYGIAVVRDSMQTHATTMKTLVMPEWWLLAPLPATFMLMAIEFGFRMARLVYAPRAPREEAVSAA